jgi:hypothetical protein
MRSQVELNIVELRIVESAASEWTMEEQGPLHSEQQLAVKLNAPPVTKISIPQPSDEVTL